MLGGVVAGALGFAASELDLLNTRTMNTDLGDRIDQQAERITALENVERPAPAEPGAPATVDLSGIESSLTALQETVGSLETRLTELENRPAPVQDSSPAISEDYAEELAALQSSIEAQKSEIDELLANARSVEEATAEAARQSAAQSALANLTAALNNGEAYADPLEDLSQAGVAEVPAPLRAPASTGVATLQSLQIAFPENARAALAAARSAGADTGESGAIGFLRRQLGARSVQPRSGDDPDAILSRAEAAVREGRLQVALTEIDSLPEQAQAAMEEWLTKARARVEAQAALSDLSQRVAGN